MARIAYIQNGATAKNGRRRKRRRNGTATAPKATAARRRNGTTKAGAMAFAKKNGLKLVSRTVANGKRKRHHKRKRNGVVASSRSTGIFSRNGLLGNTKSDAKRVVSVIAGAGVTKVVSSIVSNFASPYLAQVGLGKYANIIIDAGLALTLAPMVGKHLGDPNDARLGGLLVVGVDIISAVAPSVLQYTPFNSSPVVLNGGAALLTPAAVTQIVGATSATPSEAAKVAGAMAALQAGRGIRRSTSVRRQSMLPVYQ